MARLNQPDIILTDMNMPGISGIALAEKLKTEKNPIKVIVLTMHDNQPYIVSAFKAGAAAYLFKNISADELLFAIKQVHAGRKYLSAELGMRLLDQAMSSPLKTEKVWEQVDFSERELSILALIAEGYTNQEIADRLYTSKRTVEGHRQAMIERTGVRNTAALVRFAMQNGLLE